MKRPLTGCCILFLIFILVMQTAGDAAQDLPLFQTERILAEQVGEDTSITASGLISECSTLSSGVRLFMDHLTINSENNSELSFLPETRLTFITEQTTLRPGDFVQVSGFCTLFSSASNPGQFDERAYYFSKNTVCTLKKAEILQHRDGMWNLSGALYGIRSAFIQSFHRILDEKTAGTITAVVLGEKSAMDPEWKNLFQEGGIAHILAVSGLHITMVGMSLYRMIRRLGLPIAGAAVLSAVVVFLYALMTGFGLSAVRACVMFLIWLGAQVSGRKYDMITAAAVAAAVIMGNDADSVREASFLLSFSAVLTLATLLPAGETACNIQSAAGKSVFPCLIVWLGTLPVTLYFFYQSAPWSILVNLAVVPLMSLVMAAGIGAAVVGLVSTVFGTFAAAPVHYLLYLFEGLCRLEQKLPLSVWVTGRPSWQRIVVYYLLLLLLLVISAIYNKKDSSPKKRERREKSGPARLYVQSGTGRMRILWLFGMIFCIVLMIPPRNQKLQITCLDVGQGDSSLIRLPGGQNCLIDGGSTSVSKVWKYRIEDAVKYYGADTLDYIFLSHADQDHISGVKEFLEDYQGGFGDSNAGGITLKNLVLPPTMDKSDFAELTALASQNGIRVLIMQQGACIQGTGGWNITCLAPEKDALSGDKNEDSMVLMLEYGSFRMLFTGDLEGEAEQQLVRSDADLQADVLKAGHHGSKNSSSEPFLQKVRPEFTVISCGKDNSYGHPAPETMLRLEGVDSQILQTAVNGAVIIRSDGKVFSVETCLSPEKG